MKKILWTFGVRASLREPLKLALPGYDIRFLSVKRSILKEESEILAAGDSAIVVWKGLKAPDHDAFVKQSGLPVLGFDPIELGVLNDSGDLETQVVGIKVIAGRNTAADEPLLTMPDLPASKEAELAWQLRVLSGAAGSDWLLKIGPRAESGRKRAFLSPTASWMAACFKDGNFERFLSVVRRDFPDYDLILTTGNPRDFFEDLQSGGLVGVVRAECRPEWLHAVDAVITNDGKLITAAEHLGITAHASVDFADWVLPEDDGDLDILPSAESEQAVTELFLRGCHYFPPAGSDAAADDRLAGLRALIARRRDTVRPGEQAPLVEVVPGGDGYVDPATIPVTQLTGTYPIRHFDDRTRPCTLTCILPFRYSPDRPDAVDRLQYALIDSSWKDQDICFLVVDDGSEETEIERVRAVCRELGYSYIYNDSREGDFSVGRCRNIGAEFSRSQFIFMQDIDLMPYEGFYRDLVNEIDVQGMRENSKHFLMVPYIFLTELGTGIFQRTEPGLRRQKMIQAAITNDKKLIEKYSTGTSANLYNRHWYLTRGGNRKDFEGWGYEDIEFNTRMIRHLKFFPLPRDWSVEKFNFNTVLDYATYKATYRLFGDMAMMKGIALFHAWHPVIRDGSYAEKANLNREIFIQKLKEFPATGAEPDPLPDRSKGKTLILRKNAFTISRKVSPAFGEQILLPRESLIPNRATLEAFVRHHGITRVLFFNPYQTRHMRRLQEWVRELGIPYLIAERGALPNSNFYDPNGFLFDSATYAPEQWNNPLTPPQRMKVQEYVGDLRRHKPALETQLAPISGLALRQQLGIPADDIVIFVPLQRPGDTVTRFFSRGTSYAKFTEQVADLASRDIPGVTVLIKTHPLEDHARNWGRALIVDDANIYDLLEASNLVWTYNSGVGVLAMAWEKYVALTGSSFYASEGLNSYVRSVDEVIELARQAPVVDTETAMRYLHHLTQNVYSFGKHEVKPVRMPDGSRMTATTNIDYTCLRIDGIEHVFPERDGYAVDRTSILFDRYRYAEQNPPPPPAPAPAKAK